MVSFFPQQRPLCCFLILLTWILILIVCFRFFGFGAEEGSRYQIPILSEPKYVFKSFPEYKENVPYDKYGKLYKSCNILPTMSLGTEGKVNNNYTLESILIMLRHGDRGPLYHIRDMSRIPCNNNYNHLHQRHQLNAELYSNFTNLLYGYSSQSNFPFPFLNSYFHHSVLPNSKSCEIGQLTSTGMQQLLKLGNMLKSVYYKRLMMTTPSSSGRKIVTSSVNGDIILYSTKYKRTLLSATAFLYGFLNGAEDLSSPTNNNNNNNNIINRIVFHEAFSLVYCFDDCVCPASDALYKAYVDENRKRIKSHSAVRKLIKRIGPIVFTSADMTVTKDLYALRDALLAYVCHDAALPCTEQQHPSSSTRCVRYQDVAQLFSYADWDMQQSSKSSELRKFCLLKAYGMVKNIVSYLLKMVAERKPKVVVYSAHDKTMHMLLIAFGILRQEAMFPKYASRVIIEMYRNSSSVKNADVSLVEQYYFRLVYNGKDITKDVTFCNDKYQEIVHVNKRTNHTSKTYICSIENVVRFLHDDYFSIFNSTNYKDACEYKFLKAP